MTLVYIALLPNRVIGGVFQSEEKAREFNHQKAKKRGIDTANYKVLARLVRS